MKNFLFYIASEQTHSVPLNHLATVGLLGLLRLSVLPLLLPAAAAAAFLFFFCSDRGFRSFFFSVVMCCFTTPM